MDIAERKLRGEAVDNAALAAEMQGLFGAPGGNEIDVVALACTHFPLIADELAATAPRACMWLDSGEAIASRRQSADRGEGRATVGRAGFTDGTVANALTSAFGARGFSTVSAIGPTPAFDATRRFALKT